MNSEMADPNKFDPSSALATSGADAAIHFFHPKAPEWKRVIETHSVEDALIKVRGGRDAWIITTYIMLRTLGRFPVVLTDQFVPDALCLCHSDDVPRSNYPWRTYLVVARADRDRAFFCEAEIVQSPGAVDHRHCYYIPHWTQPGLLPRTPDTKHRVRKLGYFGELRNLAAKFRHPSFTSSLRELGLELVIRDTPETWPDYSDIDAVLAVRDGADYFLAGKPATKLFNAWTAGVPIIVGSEPAYNHYRKSELDFFLATSPAEVIAALRSLIEHPELYQKMVENGFRRAREVDRQATADAWCSLFANVLYPNHSQAVSKPLLTRATTHYIRHSLRRVRKALRGNMYVRGYDEQGQRVVAETKIIRRMGRLLDRQLMKIFD